VSRATDYVPRLADEALDEMLEVFPAVLVGGPRAAGKTTTAARRAAQIVRLDRPEPAAVFRADPDAALRRVTEPALLDEWQEVPEILGAVKRAVDDDARPGRFLLTGSVRADLEQQTWPATGRAVRLRMYGLTEREIQGRGVGAVSFTDRLASADPDRLGAAAESPDLPGYIDRALRGTLPHPALHLVDADQRNAWYDSYLEELLTRDVPALSARRDPVRLRRYFEVLAASTAGMPTDATLYRAGGVDAKTAAAYESLFAALFVYDEVPAYSNNRLARLSKARKRYLVDPALVGAALRVGTDEVLDDPDLFGRLVDTFAMAQLRAEIALAPRPYQLFHVREAN
jgi:predicted AAA+ superfamily ATPase